MPNSTNVLGRFSFFLEAQSVVLSINGTAYRVLRLLGKGSPYHIDCEYNRYRPAWDFEHQGMQYWHV